MTDGDVCFYCNQVEDTRPYGPGGRQVCLPCTMENAERNATAVQAFLAQLDAAVAMSGGFGAVLDDGNGPVPLQKEQLE